MFSVYGVTGQTFRGSLETLKTVPGLTAARAARGIDRDGEEFGPELRAAGARRRDAGTTAEAPYDQQAAEAYREAMRGEIDRGPIYHVAQVMSRDVMTLSADSRVDAAWRLLIARGIGQAPVLDAFGRLVGMVSRENLLTALNVEAGEVRNALARSVADVMISPVVSADPVTDIRRVARVLLDYHLTAVPVMDQRDALVGLVSRGDILRVVVNEPPLSLWA